MVNCILSKHKGIIFYNFTVVGQNISRESAKQDIFHDYCVEIGNYLRNITESCQIVIGDSRNVVKLLLDNVIFLKKD